MTDRKTRKASKTGATGEARQAHKTNKARKGTLGKVLRYLAAYRPLMLLSLLLALINVAGVLTVPILIGKAIDCAVEGAVDLARILSLALVALVVILIAAFAQWLMGVINNRVTYAAVRDLRRDAFHHLQTLPLSYLDSHPHGDIVSRITTDADGVGDGLLLGFSQLFTGLLTIVGTLIFMFVISWPIALAVLFVTPVSLFVARFIGTRTHRHFRHRAEVQGNETAFIDEMLSGAKVVKAFARETVTSAEFDDINKKYEKASLSASFFSSLTNPTTRFVNSLVYAAVVLVGAMLALSSQGPATAASAFTVGALSTLLAYTNQYTKPFNEISGVVTEFQNALACADRLFALLEEPAESADWTAPPVALSTALSAQPSAETGAEEAAKPAAEGAVEGATVAATVAGTTEGATAGATAGATTGATEGAVTFDHVSFRYLPDKPLIEDFSLSVKPGQRVAIVGPTGCGKTTLINLIMRFYDVTGGAILLDGQDIRSLPRADLRKKIGMVLQETWLKNATVRENIAMARPDASDSEIVAAAKAAHAHSFIRRLPQGYDTPLGEGGGSLSQGQRQLLCIARVMLALPPMLILDEATSSIDTRTEQKIQSAFARLMEGRTSFIVAHRLSTIRFADLILVMRDGKIIEQGKHDELLAKNGFYAALYRSQFA